MTLGQETAGLILQLANRNGTKWNLEFGCRKICHAT